MVNLVAAAFYCITETIEAARISFSIPHSFFFAFEGNQRSTIVKHKTIHLWQYCGWGGNKGIAKIFTDKWRLNCAKVSAVSFRWNGSLALIYLWNILLRLFWKQQQQQQHQPPPRTHVLRVQMTTFVSVCIRGHTFSVQTR